MKTIKDMSMSCFFFCFCNNLIIYFYNYNGMLRFLTLNPFDIDYIFILHNNCLSSWLILLTCPQFWVIFYFILFFQDMMIKDEENEILIIIILH